MVPSETETVLGGVESPWLLGSNSFSHLCFSPQEERRNRQKEAAEQNNIRVSFSFRCQSTFDSTFAALPLLWTAGVEGTVLSQIGTPPSRVLFPSPCGQATYTCSQMCRHIREPPVVAFDASRFPCSRRGITTRGATAMTRRRQKGAAPGTRPANSRSAKLHPLTVVRVRIFVYKKPPKEISVDVSSSVVEGR